VVVFQEKKMSHGQAQFDVVRIKLDTVQDRAERQIVGHVFQVIDASSSSAALSITVNEPDARSYPVRVGFGWQHSPFTRVFITNAAQAGEWVDVAFGGDPLAAKPELFRVFAVSNASAVTIEGQSGNLAVDIAAQSVGDVGVSLKESTVAKVNVVPAEILLDSASPMYTTVPVSLLGNTTGFVTKYTVPAGKTTTIRRGVLLSTANGPMASARIVINGVNVVRADNGSTRATLPCFEGYKLPAGSLIQLKNNTAGSSAMLGLWMEEV
jgi:hypothetical protein